MFGHTYWGAQVFPTAYWGAGDTGGHAYAISAEALSYSASITPLPCMASVNGLGYSSDSAPEPYSAVVYTEPE
ncbi:MAG: hypothetical protein WC485_11460 [Opitutaceae bacterium]